MAERSGQTNAKYAIGIGHLIANLVVENYFTFGVFRLLHLSRSLSPFCLTFCRYTDTRLHTHTVQKPSYKTPSQLKMRSILIADVQTQ